MTYEETIEWMNRYRAARRVEPRLREWLPGKKAAAPSLPALCAHPAGSVRLTVRAEHQYPV